MRLSDAPSLIASDRQRFEFANLNGKCGRVRIVEVHQNEAHGIGKKEMKIKLLLLD